MPSSALYVGRIRHRRMSHPEREFSHRVWYALLDLDELPEVTRRIPLLSHNRPNLISFDDRDHMGPDREDVRSKLERWLISKGVEPPGGAIFLLTHLRLAGHVFNPVSFFYCHDPDQMLRQVVAEVNNTFGETYCYLLEAETANAVVQSEHDKVFHVSPFQPTTGQYRFRVTPPGARLTVHIDVVRDGNRAFDATLSAERRPLSSGTLVRILARQPRTGLQTLGLIHYQALLLWLKRAPFFTKPEPPPGAWRTRHGQSGDETRHRDPRRRA
jgi:DUF1365 family protein